MVSIWLEWLVPSGDVEQSEIVCFICNSTFEIKRESDTIARNDQTARVIISL